MPPLDDNRNTIVLHAAFLPVGFDTSEEEERSLAESLVEQCAAGGGREQRTVRSFEVRVPDSVENADLDNRFFFTYLDALLAAELVVQVRGLSLDPADLVSSSVEEPELTFESWSERGW